MNSGTIYYIACTLSGRVKIGYTSGDVEKRLRALQTGAPAALVLMACHPGTVEDERALHEKYWEQRVHGEWFKMSEDLFRHLSMIVWLAAKQALSTGDRIERWITVGLETMHTEIGPLPDDLAVLIDIEPVGNA